MPDLIADKDMEIMRLKQLVRMGVEVVEDFLPNIGVCALQNYGRLNEFLILTDTKEFRPEGDG